MTAGYPAEPPDYPARKGDVVCWRYVRRITFANPLRVEEREVWRICTVASARRTGWIKSVTWQGSANDVAPGEVSVLDVAHATILAAHIDREFDTVAQIRAIVKGEAS